jgi:hypothetical protein
MILDSATAGSGAKKIKNPESRIKNGKCARPGSRGVEQREVDAAPTPRTIPQTRRNFRSRLPAGEPAANA